MLKCWGGFGGFGGFGVLGGELLFAGGLEGFVDIEHNKTFVLTCSVLPHV